ncbi:MULTISPECIES: serine--tRNA ligase [Asticcacaulis]|uniref:serine--tRNA ligase n=1 Tax=Asticcacaulis TaxID=76890 RepID=UPI001AE95160|nr:MULTISPECIES: serine--tRNA ligase [Asticcacaulis]MBP2158540.1 seryl-tRNA synthetase [Asticcacaulis solisilvae]MDR6799586.1 seryl-tRNA synthetase [Asticcacaulis sp. BE141]
MHDIKALRDNPEAYVRGWSSRGRDSAQSDVDGLIALDKDLRAAKTAFETNQAQLKKLSGEIGKAKAQKDEAKASELMAEVEALKGAIATAQEQERLKDEALRDALAALPNVPFEDVPQGADEHGNVEVRKHGAPNVLSFTPKDHADLGEALGFMDFEAAAKMSGSRFVVLKGQLARLERAIGQWMLDTQTTEHGYMEVNPPVLVRGDALFGTGQLPKFEEDLFKTTDDRYLIPTAEVTLTNLVREAITAEEELPLRLTALTNCFRAEAGSAGRDTKGMIRQHQFQKVELVSITTPEQSADEHERMTQCAEAILKKLDLSFRTMLLCTGDMGFGARKTYDLEVWLPSQNTYREISSCSNCGDFQARRMDARTRKAGEKGTRFVHTLNGSGLAVGRTLVAIMENYQDEGGRIAVPAVLQSYMGGLTHIG